MIRNEQQLKQESIKTGLFGCVIAIIVSILLKKLYIIGGYFLGVIISYVVLLIDCQAADGILKSKINRPYMISILFFIFKLGIYAIGFVIAVKIPVIFNVFSVFVGYLTTKLTIYRLALTRR